METHKTRLLLVCRSCGEQSIDLKRKNPKVNLNINVKLNVYYFGDDADGIHPPNVCSKCKRKLEAIDKKLKNFLRKTHGGVISAFKASLGNQIFPELLIFTEHENNCIICPGKKNEEVGNNENMHAAIQDSETFNARSVNEESGETQVVEDTGNEGEVTEDTTNIVLYQCSICFNYGRNKRKCPHLGRR